MDKDAVKNLLIDALFPKFCMGCRFEGTYLCSDCRSLLEILEYRYCLCLKKPFRIPIAENRGKCNSCREQKLSGLHFALPYRSQTVKRLIHQFKYEPYVKDLAPTLASLIVEHLVKSGANAEAFWEDVMLVPVPADSKKIKLRGYNQSALLAAEISKAINTPLAETVLMKIKGTKPQMELSKQERQQNLIGAFAIKNPELVVGKRIFLVDDVYTTGATMEACATALKAAGAQQVWGLCLAREE